MGLIGSGSFLGVLTRSDTRLWRSCAIILSRNYRFTMIMAFMSDTEPDTATATAAWLREICLWRQWLSLRWDWSEETSYSCSVSTRDKVRCMLIDVKLTPKISPYAACYAVLINNSLPQSAVSPNGAYGDSSHFSKLYVFGMLFNHQSFCISWIKDQQTNSFLELTLLVTMLWTYKAFEEHEAARSCSEREQDQDWCETKIYPCLWKHVWF